MRGSAPSTADLAVVKANSERCVGHYVEGGGIRKGRKIRCRAVQDQNARWPIHV
jgi:hypothetical protein